MIIKILAIFLSEEKIILLRRIKNYLFFILPKIYLQISFFLIKKIPPSNRKPKIIVSLTSIPPRFRYIHFAIKSILKQTVLPDKIILYLSKEHKREEFKNCSFASLPKSLIKLQEKGLEICFVKDIGSYRKLLPSLKRFSDDIIITIDDDIVYPKDTIEKLYSAYLGNGNNFVYCTRSRIIEKGKNLNYIADKLNFSSNNNHKNLFITGGAGTLYPPKVLSKQVFSEEVFAKLAPFEDDSWFNAMRLLNKNKAFQVDSKEIYSLPSYYSNALWHINCANNRKEFNKQFNSVFNYYKLFDKSS